MADILKKLKVIIIVLSVLLGISLTALAGVFIYQRTSPGDSKVIPNNYIEPARVSAKLPVTVCASLPNFGARWEALYLARTIVDRDRADDTVLSIYRNQPEDSTPFSLPNMFPGDSEMKSYFLEVSHRGSITLYFHADIHKGYEKLSEVLWCKVEVRGEDTPLYEGLMKDMPESVDYPLPSRYGRPTELVYDITVSLDTSVGNDYMNKELMADFRWWAEATGDDDDEPITPSKPDDPIVPSEPEPSEPSEPIDPDDGELIDPPPTGDTGHVFFWLTLMIASLSFLVLLFKKYRKEGEDE